MEKPLSIKVDDPLCTACRLCEIGCSIFHEDLVNLSKSCIRVEDDYPHSLFHPRLCQLCEEPACVNSCPTVALTQKADSGVIELNKELCNLCLACVQACPYHAIFWNEEQEKLYICDLCNGNPTCVRVCTSGALKI